MSDFDQRFFRVKTLLYAVAIGFMSSHIWTTWTALAVGVGIILGLNASAYAFCSVTSGGRSVAGDLPYPPPPPGQGWFRVESSDAGVVGPGWMRCTSQGNDYRSDADRTPGFVWDDFAEAAYTCTRASLAGLEPCTLRVRVHGERKWRTVRRAS